MIRYPTGVKMRNYRRPRLRRRGHQKYPHHRRKIDGHTFESDAELHYYRILKIEGKSFRVHPKLTYRTRHCIKSKTDGKLVWIRKRSYKPDFVIMDNEYDGKPLTPDNPHIREIDDVKGSPNSREQTAARSRDNAKFDDFTDSDWHIPITIVTFKRGRVIKKTRGEKN